MREEKFTVSMDEDEGKRAKVKVQLILDGEVLHEVEGGTIIGMVIRMEGEERVSETLIGPEINKEEVTQAITDLISTVMEQVYDADDKDNIIDFKSRRH